MAEVVWPVDLILSDFAETSAGADGQPLGCLVNRRYLNWLMLKSQSPQSRLASRKLRIRIWHAVSIALCLGAALLTLPPSANAQADFTLVAAPFSPDAVAPTGTSSSNITIGTLNGFSGTVSLGCTVASNQPTTSDPVCTVSPATVTPPAGATVTITTVALTTPASYNITITGTGPSTTHTTPSESLTVLAVTPQFTITVQSPVVPSSVPAGNGAQGVILITPINGYMSPGWPKQGITLSCASITPLVTYPPICSFSYPPGLSSLPVNGSPATSTLTITVPGPQNIAAASPPRMFYALWLPLPMLVMAGLGAAGGKRSRKAWGLLALFIMAGSFFLLPACTNTVPHTEALQGVTPNNTYSFTVIGVDADGNVSSNTSSSNSTNPTVTLTVTSPTL